MLIANAYENGHIDGGPAWADLDRYDLEAKVDASDIDALSKLGRDEQVHQLDLALQVLLTDRFRLKIHDETKEVPAYALAISKNGPKFKEGKLDDPSLPNGALRMTPGQITGQGVSMERLASALTLQLKRPVLDKTGLSAIYDFSLNWETGEGSAPIIHSLPEGVQQAPSPDDSASAMPAAMQQQLGLKLESTKTAAKVLVVDHIERPSAN